MALLNTKSKGLSAFGIGSTQTIDKKEYEKSDFPNGLIITEIVNGQKRETDKVVLLGAFAPHDEIPFGGTQRIIKEYYSGSQDPSIQILGPSEDDITIKGCFKEKRFTPDLAGSALEYQELVDAMRIRGNLVEIVLGEWKRYGFVSKSIFKLKRANYIEYEITFVISGFTIPKNYYLVDGFDNDLIKPNKDLTNKALAFLKKLEDKPTTIPKSVSDLMNDAISGVASKISEVTGFVNGILDDVDKIKSSAERAIGVVRNTRVFISKTSRRIASIPNSISSLAKSGISEAEKMKDTINHVTYMNEVIALNKQTALLLVGLQKKLEANLTISQNQIHIVKDGETLQKISIKYLGSADKWIDIKELNKLQGTNLKSGSILKIPK